MSGGRDPVTRDGESSTEASDAAGGVPAGGAARARELRGQIRDWRRGRADTPFWDAFVDAYVWVFAAVMLSSTLAVAIVNVRRTTECHSLACHDARTVLPWTIGLGLLALVLGVARLFGPVFGSPAEGSWLLAAPVQRRPLLRGRLVVSVVAAGVLVGVLALGVAALAVFPGEAVAAFAVGFALLAAGLVSLAASLQHTGGQVVRAVSWVLGLIVWAALLVLATAAVPTTGVPPVGTVWVVLLGVLAVLVALLLWRAVTGLDRLRRRDLVPGGRLGPSLSGALSALDFALLYDVLVSRRWQGVGAVRSRRGGPRGAGALVRRELVRLLRDPQPWLLLTASVVVPYAGATIGLGHAVVLLSSLGTFLTGIWLLGGLRNLTRSASLNRAFPFPDHTLRLAVLSVPGAAMLVAGTAATAAVHDVGGGSWSLAFTTSVAAGVSATAASARWVTGRPPDYSRPLVTSPAGAIPVNLYGTVLRGFDVLVLTTGPLLIWHSGGGVMASLALSLITLSYLLGRK